MMMNPDSEGDLPMLSPQLSASTPIFSPLSDRPAAQHEQSPGPEEQQSAWSEEQLQSPGPDEQQQQLVAAVIDNEDAFFSKLRDATRQQLRPAVVRLSEAMRSEMVAHVLMLYRYTRLQSKLIVAEGWTRYRAAKHLNPWISQTYGDETCQRIKNTAHRLFDLFREPSDDDEWWPMVFREAGENSRAKHLLESLILLSRYHEPIAAKYLERKLRLELYRHYAHDWSAKEIEQDLIANEVIPAKAGKGSQSDEKNMVQEAQPAAAAVGRVDNQNQADASNEDGQSRVRRARGKRVGRVDNQNQMQASEEDAATEPQAAASSSSTMGEPDDARLDEADRHDEYELKQLLQPVWDAMLEADRDNIHRLVLKGPPPKNGRPVIYLPAVIQRCSNDSLKFDHLVIETPPLWQAELYNCIKSPMITLDPTQFTTGYRTTLQLVSLAEEVSGLTRDAVAQELKFEANEAVGSAVADVTDNPPNANESPASSMRVSSACDRIRAIFGWLEKQWKQPTQSDSSPPPLINGQLYMQNLSPADLRGGPDALRPGSVAAAAAEEKDADPSSSFFHSRSAQHQSALCQDHFKLHARSLHDLLPTNISCPGIFESLLYFKDGVVSFPLHGEQMGMRFTHHQLSGDTLWIILKPGQNDKLRELAYRMAIARACSLKPSISRDVRNWSDSHKSAARDIAWILFLAKTLMPPLSLLNELGIEWRAEFIQAGRIITGRGDACHFGFSISDAQTVSFATNQLDMDYLEYGPSIVLEHMKWLKNLHELQDKSKLDNWLEFLAVPADWLRLALNNCPPPLVCGFFTALRRDLTDGRSKRRRAAVAGKKPKVRTYEAHYGNQPSLLEALHVKDGICDQILQKMHESNDVLQKYYEDTSNGGRNLVLCSHYTFNLSPEF